MFTVVLKSKMLKIIAVVLFLFLVAQQRSYGADHIIPNPSNLEEYFWTYGCTPTASSMVLGYWDNQSYFGKLIDHYYTNQCSNYTVPNMIDELRACMGTDWDVNTCTGSGLTYYSDISGGLQCTTNNNNGYSFSYGQCTDCTDWWNPFCWGGNYCWDEMKAEINAGRPFVWSASGASSGHSVAAWGYRDDNYAIIYDTWWPGGREDWYYSYYTNNSSDPIVYAQVERLYPGGWSDSEISLDSPNGGETITANHPYTIWWHQWGTTIDNVDIYYSTDKGRTWSLIASWHPSVEGWNSYTWNVPNVSSASSARIRISAYDYNTYMSGDGSLGNFTINMPTCSLPNYPTTKWQRVWSQYSTAYCLGDGPDEINLEFDNNWGSGTVAHNRSDDIHFYSSRAIYFSSSGTYRFTVGSDDGVGLLIDGIWVLDKFIDRPYTIDTVDVNLTAGYHNIILNYYERGGDARVSFAYDALSDLIVQSITTSPVSPSPGQNVNVTVAIKNQGAGNAGAFDVDFYKNRGTAPLPGDMGDAWCSKSGLAAGATDTCVVTVSYATAGTYKMWAKVDTFDNVSESNESNNVYGPQNIVVQNYNLTVTKAGTGSGTVTSSPAGINCGTDCTEPYNYGTSVTLTAAAATGSAFAGWSGACTGTATTCTVTMDAAKSVTATFDTGAQLILTVTKAGTGSGTVTSSPAGVNCGTDCSEPYIPGTVVTLTATAATGSTFAGWSGVCSGTGTCTVTMDAAKSVTATFNKVYFEENDASVTYTGVWNNYVCTPCSSGNLKVSKQTGAKATFTFTGTGVKWIAAKANKLGIAKVSVDGVFQTNVDLYSSTNKVKQAVYQKTGLASGVHTITIEVTGTKNGSATDYFIDIDAFEITP